MSFDKIHLKGITAKGYHGFYDKERAIGQNFVVDVLMDVDSPNASIEDNLEKTVDYEKVGKAVIRVIEGEAVKLIETLAERIALVVLCFEGVCQVSVTVHKPQAPLDYQFEDVSLTITRNRSNLRIGFENSSYFIKKTNLFEELYTQNLKSTNPQTITPENNLNENTYVQDFYTEVETEKSLVKNEIEEPEEKTDLIDIAETGCKDFPPIFKPEKANVVLALGANLGDPVKMFQDVILDLDRSLGFEVLEVSPLIKSKAQTLNDEEQPDYYNCVLEGKTFLSEKDLLGLVKEIEYYFGRRENGKWQPRIIDIDIIKYNDDKYEDEDLSIPHKLAKQRAFVLMPWNLMDSEATLEGEKVSYLLEYAPDKDGILKVWSQWLTKTMEELEEEIQPNYVENIYVDDIRLIESDVDIYVGEQIDFENILDSSQNEEMLSAVENVEEKNENILIDISDVENKNKNHDENLDYINEFSAQQLETTNNLNEDDSNHRITVDENIDEVLHTLEHTKVMNQLRTLFDNGVEDETITKIENNNQYQIEHDKTSEEKYEEKIHDSQNMNKHIGNYQTHQSEEKQTLERASIYEALRKKTFDEAMSVRKDNLKNTFKPKWQSVGLDE